MPDARAKHFHYPPTLMNQETAPFPGAANAIYGDRGPRRAFPDYHRRKPLSGAPQSLEHYIQDSIARVPDLSPRQKLALRNTIMTMTRDIGFIRLIHEQTHGLRIRRRPRDWTRRATPSARLASADGLRRCGGGCAGCSPVPCCVLRACEGSQTQKISLSGTETAALTQLKNKKGLDQYRTPKSVMIAD
jgi:hypothetical protein